MDKSHKNFRAEARLPTAYGDFDLIAIAKSNEDWMPHLIMKHIAINTEEVVTVRIHSECITGDLFQSKRCDCGAQLEKSMEIIEEQKGLLIYLRQEGRGIGIINKLKAYNLQDEGMDTFEANTHLGFADDAREFEVAIKILNDLGIRSIKLLTNNPEKIKAFDESNINVIERIPLNIPPNNTNKKYLQSKKDKMGHLLDLGNK